MQYHRAFPAEIIQAKKCARFATLFCLGLLGFHPGCSAIFAIRPASASEKIGGEALQKTGKSAPEVALITVGKQTGDPGALTVVPVHFTLNPDLQLATAELEISYPATALEFVEVDNELPKRVAVKAGSASEAGDSLARVDIQFKAASESAQKFLPSGLIAYLVFRIREEAVPGDVALKTSGKVTLAENRSISAESVTAVDGKIRITTPRPSIYGCFFYMH